MKLKPSSVVNASTYRKILPAVLLLLELSQAMRLLSVEEPPPTRKLVLATGARAMTAVGVMSEVGLAKERGGPIENGGAGAVRATGVGLKTFWSHPFNTHMGIHRKRSWLPGTQHKKFRLSVSNERNIESSIHGEELLHTSDKENTSARMENSKELPRNENNDRFIDAILRLKEDLIKEKNSFHFNTKTKDFADCGKESLRTSVTHQGTETPLDIGMRSTDFTAKVIPMYVPSSQEIQMDSERDGYNLLHSQTVYMNDRLRSQSLYSSGQNENKKKVSDTQSNMKREEPLLNQAKFVDIIKKDSNINEPEPTIGLKIYLSKNSGELPLQKYKNSITSICSPMAHGSNSHNLNERDQFPSISKSERRSYYSTDGISSTTFGLKTPDDVVLMPLTKPSSIIWPSTHEKRNLTGLKKVSIILWDDDEDVGQGLPPSIRVSLPKERKEFVNYYTGGSVNGIPFRFPQNSDAEETKKLKNKNTLHEDTKTPTEAVQNITGVDWERRKSLLNDTSSRNLTREIASCKHDTLTNDRSPLERGALKGGSEDRLKGGSEIELRQHKITGSLPCGDFCCKQEKRGPGGCNKATATCGPRPGTPKILPHGSLHTVPSAPTVTLLLPLSAPPHAPRTPSPWNESERSKRNAPLITAANEDIESKSSQYVGGIYGSHQETNHQSKPTTGLRIQVRMEEPSSPLILLQPLGREMVFEETQDRIEDEDEDIEQSPFMLHTYISSTTERLKSSQVANTSHQLRPREKRPPGTESLQNHPSQKIDHLRRFLKMRRRVPEGQNKHMERSTLVSSPSVLNEYENSKAIPIRHMPPKKQKTKRKKIPD